MQGGKSSDPRDEYGIHLRNETVYQELVCDNETYLSYVDRWGDLVLCDNDNPRAWLITDTYHDPNDMR